MQTENIATKDMFLATYLKSKGYFFETQIINGSHEVTFTFPEVPQEIMEGWYNNDTEARRCKWILTSNRIIYSAMRLTREVENRNAINQVKV